MKLTMEEQLAIYGKFLTKETLTINTVVQNRSLFYIARIFKLYDVNLYNFLKKISPIAIGIADKFHKCTNDCIYVLVDSKVDFTRLENTPFYVENYIFDEIETSQLRMLVFKLPAVSKYIKHFKKSEYSKMYTDEELTIMFNVSETSSFQYKVLSGNKMHKKAYLEYVNKTFNTTLTLSDVEESDFPINLQAEIFNYS